MTSLSNSIAFWKIAAASFAAGLVTLLWLHFDPPGEEPLDRESLALLEVVLLTHDSTPEEALAVAQHYGAASELPRAPRTDGADRVIEVLDDLEPEARKGFVEWCELAALRIDQDLDSLEFEVIDHNQQR